MLQSKQSVLYISLTGMTEPLGRSQVLEYLLKLSQKYSIFLTSFEREKDLKHIDDIQKIVDEYHVAWDHQIYSNRFGVFSTIKQIFSATKSAYHTIKKNSIGIIHARSFIPAVIGMILKKMTGVKLIFDIRGFATAEKVDTGRVKKGTLLYRIMIAIEKYLYQNSDHIVTLTNVSRKIISDKFNVDIDSISVIPTCANSELFKPLSKKDREVFKQTLHYNENDRIIIHTGTVGGWYDFDSEVKLFEEVLRTEPNANFLILNRDRREFIEEVFRKYNIDPSSYRISECSLDEMHRYLSIADVSLFFIRPSYSKKASTPTKFAENLACHLPSITNKGIGDMDYYVSHYGVGEVVELDNLDKVLEKTAQRIIEFFGERTIEPKVFETVYNNYFDAKKAVENYAVIYDNLLRKP